MGEVNDSEDHSAGSSWKLQEGSCPLVSSQDLGLVGQPAAPVTRFEVKVHGWLLETMASNSSR